MRRLITTLVLALLLSFGARADAATLTGKVLGEDDKPIAGAKVMLRLWGGVVKPPDEAAAPVTVSDAKGEFRVEVEAKGAIDKIGADAVAHAPGWAVGHAYLKNGSFAVRLQKGARATGLVTDAAGQPVVGVPVRLALMINQGIDFRYYEYLSIAKPMEADFTAKTDAQGRWTIEDLPAAGSASFLLKDPKYAGASLRVELKGEVGATVEAAKLVAHPGAVLQGRVVDENGKPLADVLVTAYVEGVNGTSFPGKTGADGTYRLESLSAGVHQMQIRDAKQEWVATSSSSPPAIAGQAVAVPDLTMQKGALIEGSVSDAKTGALLSEVSIGNNSGSGGWATTDDKGFYRMRVLPGKVALYISGKPQGYLAPEAASPARQTNLDLKKDETKTVDWKLSKGLELSGTARTENGQGQGKIKIELREVSERDNWPDPERIVPDEKGAWKVDGLKAGRYELIAADEWEVVSPRQIELPMQGKVEVLLRPLEMKTFTGRVVTADGKPIEKVAIKFQIMVPVSKRNWTTREESGETDAQGQFSLGKLRPDYRVAVQATRKGFKYLRGGETETGQWIAKDVVMLPLTGRVAGRIVDAKGQALAGAKVLSPDSGGQSAALSDAEGNFVLDSLPEGEVTLVATHPSGAGAKLVRAGTNAVSLLLHPQKAVTQPDGDVAQDILEEVWQTSRGSKWWRRDQLPADLAGLDFDLALQIAHGGDDKAPLAEPLLTNLIVKLAQADPARAIEWAPAQLPLLKDNSMRLRAITAVALAAVDSKPELATQLYTEAKAIPLKTEWDILSGPASLAALAVRLKNGEAQGWIDKVLGQAKSADAISVIAPALAAGSAALAEKALDQMPADAKNYQQTSPYVDSISKLATYDVPGAMRLLDKLEKVDSNQVSYAVGQAVPSLIKAVGPRDAGAALALAKRVRNDYNGSDVLLLAARFQPKEQALTVLREAAQAVTAYDYRAISRISRIAAQAFALDAKTGVELLAQARTRLKPEGQSEQERTQWRQQEGGRETAIFAWANRLVDPVESRLLLEEEWAYQKGIPTKNRGDNQSDLVVAMATIDPSRALEMALQIHTQEDDLSSQFEVQSRIARFLLNPALPADELFSRN